MQMKAGQLVRHHRLFFVFVILFIVVGVVDMFNFDRLIYKALCDLISPLSGSPCPPYYDIPIWHVYLSLAILAALYHVHDEIRVSNKHLSSRKI
ncbi:hypothetical protein A2Z33_06040 [Candidatus Gottesmanbacteria bacterium RBG_16_52_11]|uniref:Uncharacterized protein n=1 Tax=Candidatus Gottesmanbacteria bacterium RBG_16_52_11 TaxID=1798374 RepID=A0A1F5YXB0_9BACT|nr:MAG: hypothetical protein A2Z33_06040 [Candidatus Gottesmanbacteria bacterium RBG_16_52_11]